MIPLPSASLTLQLLLIAAIPTFAQTNGIDQRDTVEELEHILVDNGGTNSDGFVNAVSPCLNYVGFASSGANRGEQSSAQWVRFAFHDFVTADLAAGTGGLDASLGFESNRAENAGLFINDTLQFMSPTVSAYLSMADNIALGVVASVATCGGSNSGIPLRAGRIDADSAGPSGVPEPSTDLASTLAQFAAAGFNQTDTIALTSAPSSSVSTPNHITDFCQALADILLGVSITQTSRISVCDENSILKRCQLRVTIVDKSFVTSTNLDGGEGFDSTPGVFDAAVVNEYLGETGLLGGPLVTAPDVANRSDYRLYISDKNVTMQSISEESSFQSTCYSLFERMINTVPSTVTLSDPIVPMPWKAVDLMLDVSSSGVVSVSGLIRNLYASTSTAPVTVSYTTGSSSGTSDVQTSKTVSGTGTSLYGSTSYFPFNSTISSGTTSLDFEGISYPINDEIFVLPAQSSVTRATKAFTVKAAALTSLDTGSAMTAVLYVPTTQQGTVTKKVTNNTFTMTSYGTAGDYTLYTTGSVTVSNAASVVIKVLLGDSASRTVKSNIFLGGF